MNVDERITYLQKRQAKIIEEQRSALAILNDIASRMDIALLYHLRDAVYEYYKPELDRINTVVDALTEFA